MSDPFHFADDLGPEKIVHITVPALGLKAIIVIDNTAAGPAIGGTRMAPDVSLEECVRLARAMTLKNAAAGLPHGGGKSVIVGNPSMPSADKEHLIRAFAVAIRSLRDYIPGPDMGTDETAMAWVKDEIGRAAGLPRELGGIPLDEIGVTGFGVAVAAEVAQSYCGVKLDGARIVVQGFGAVGRHAADFLVQRGARLVGVSDARGAIADPDGIDIAHLSALKAEGRSVGDHKRGRRIAADDLIDIECDIWIPAARPDVIRADNVDRLRTRLVLQGANIPATMDAERRMHDRGILSIPDFIANAGGVITAAVELRGGTEKSAFEAIGEKIAANTRATLDAAKAQGVPPREAATVLARTRIARAMAARRWHR
jgi:glutamate dehydrogenase (NAD(P)+)